MSRLSPTDFCGCLDRQPLRQAVRDTFDELVELLREPSRDELSDVAFGVGRILGSLTGRSYLHVPGDRLHVEKILARMGEYGCVRSKRHLVDGQCPSSGDSPRAYSDSTE